MHKVTTLLLLLALAVPAAWAQLNTDWQRTIANGNRPTWFGADTERGFALTTLDGTEVLAVVSRNSASVSPSANHIRFIDANTGADLSTLSANATVTGGTFLINDIGSTSDNNLIACNLTATLNTSPFKCYNASSNWTNVLSFTHSNAGRVGDRISVGGSCALNTAYILAASPGTNNIYNFTTSDNCNSFSIASGYPLVAAPSSGNNGNQATAVFSPDGDLFVNGHSTVIRQHTSSGTLLGTIPGTIVSTNSSAMEVLSSTVSDVSYTHLFAFQFSGNIAGNNPPLGEATYVVRVIDISGMPSTAPTATEIYATTPSLGNAVNGNGAGEVTIRKNNDGTVTIFALATNNGIASFTTTLLPLPVELTSFSAVSSGRKAMLSWVTASETNNAGFEVQRQEGEGWMSLGFVEGQGTTDRESAYAFTTGDLAAGSHSFRLRQVDFDGTTSYSPVVEVAIALTEGAELTAAYPNPTNTTAAAYLSVAQTQNVRVAVYDLLGREVAELFNGMVQSGQRERLVLDASSLAPGVYVYRATGDTFTQSQLLTVTR